MRNLGELSVLVENTALVDRAGESERADGGNAVGLAVAEREIGGRERGKVDAEHYAKTARIVAVAQRKFAHHLRQRRAKLPLGDLRLDYAGVDYSHSG